MSSYNGDILQDGDSTNFVIGFLKAMNNEIPQKELDKWYHFMNADGGWVTYKNGEALKDLLNLESNPTAWLTPKVCVTAASTYVLSKFDNSTYLAKSIDYLVSEFQENHWKSYWWTSEVYATAFAVMALIQNDAYKLHCEKAMQFLLGKQHTEGYWLNEKTNEPSNFYTALAVKALSMDSKNQYKLATERGVSFLQKMQMADGTWQSTRILQIPNTRTENPADIQKWNNSSFGVNILTDDYNRIFTTATVVNALHCYQKKSKVFLSVA